MSRIWALRMFVCGQGGSVKIAIFRIFIEIHDFAKRLTGAK